MDVWFTSDSHFGHARVIEYSHRPFACSEDMDEAMVKNWNAVVRPGDRVYHLGDFSFHKPERTLWLLSRLAGNKYLIFGNHDKRSRKDPTFIGRWIWSRDLESIDVDGQKIVLCHYPMLTWSQSHHGSWQLHGHCHGSLRDDPHSLRLDVGVDCWDYQPVSFEVLRSYMAKKTFKPVDHHGRDEEVE